MSCSFWWHKSVQPTFHMYTSLQLSCNYISTSFPREEDKHEEESLFNDSKSIWLSLQRHFSLETTWCYACDKLNGRDKQESPSRDFNIILITVISWFMKRTSLWRETLFFDFFHSLLWFPQNEHSKTQGTVDTLSLYRQSCCCSAKGDVSQEETEDLSP